MRDPLHDRAGTGTRWTIVNTAENFPDVASPLGLLEKLDYGLTGTTKEGRAELVAMLDRVRAAAGD